MYRNKMLILLTGLVLSVSLLSLSASAQSGKDFWKFVSIPDFVNVDVKFPEPTWDDALDYMLKQIAHGGLFSYNTDVNYLVVTVTPSEMYCELKEIETVLEERKLPQSAGNEPYEYVRIPPETKREGFRTVGTMTVRKEGNKKSFVDKTGYFIEDNNPKK